MDRSSMGHSTGQNTKPHQQFKGIRKKRGGLVEMKRCIDTQQSNAIHVSHVHLCIKPNAKIKTCLREL